jgi:sec-independent protein translocase protein TatB
VFNLQGSEIIVILLLALVVLGPEKLPDAVRKFTQTYAELKKMSTGFQSELKSALDEPMREIRETAKLVRDAADPNAIMAEAEAERRVLDDADARTSRTGEPTATDDWSAPAPTNDWSAPTPGTAASDDPPPTS